MREDQSLDERRRGVLYPGRLPEFHRLAPPSDLAHAISWFWIPQWNLPDGVESVQQLLPFPACNLVIERDGMTAVGPPTRRSERVLRGRGWAVGALLRPAAAAILVGDPAALRDGKRTLDEPELVRAVTREMDPAEDEGSAPGSRRSSALAAFSNWIRDRVPQPVPGSDRALANELGALIADPRITRVDQLAPELHTSTRTLQRVASRHFGLSLHSMIRRRRLQEAAESLRDGRADSITRLAGELGYADHAHFTSDFRAVLGMTPSEYRSTARGGHPSRVDRLSPGDSSSESSHESSESLPESPSASSPVRPTRE